MQPLSSKAEIWIHTPESTAITTDLCEVSYNNVRNRDSGSPRCINSSSKRLTPWVSSSLFHSLSLHGYSSVSLFKVLITNHWADFVTINRLPLWETLIRAQNIKYTNWVFWVAMLCSSYYGSQLKKCEKRYYNHPLPDFYACFFLRNQDQEKPNSTLLAPCICLSSRIWSERSLSRQSRQIIRSFLHPERVLSPGAQAQKCTNTLTV